MGRKGWDGRKEEVDGKGWHAERRKWMGRLVKRREERIKRRTKK